MTISAALTAPHPTPSNPPTPPSARYHDPGNHAPAATPPSLEPEAALRAAAVAGDRTAFAALYSVYRDTVFHYLVRRCRGDRHLAEDLTQDTFIRALSRLAGYRETGRPFGAWLVTIAGNLLIDHWRSSWNRHHILWHDFSGDGSDGRLIGREEAGGDPATTVTASEQQRQLVRMVASALGRLSSRQQQVLLLRFAEGRSVADTAQALGVEEGAVKAATYRARRALACDPGIGKLR